MEITPFLGYTFSEGIDLDDSETDTGDILEKITPVSGFSYGIDVGFIVQERFTFGFAFTQQESELELAVKGAGKTSLTDMAVRNYHGIVAYTHYDQDTMVRPFVFFGLGATQYAPSAIKGRDVSSETKFSFTLGGGVKIFTHDHIGFRFQGKWIPTYINSSDEGYWYGYYNPWGYYAYPVSTANYSHQLELTAGLIMRF
jgi:opacity protein-like surface antigen